MIDTFFYKSNLEDDLQNINYFCYRCFLLDLQVKICEHQIETFNKLLRYEKISIENVLDQVEVFGNYLLEAALRTKCIFVPIWTLAAFRRVVSLTSL